MITPVRCGRNSDQRSRRVEDPLHDLRAIHQAGYALTPPEGTTLPVLGPVPKPLTQPGFGTIRVLAVSFEENESQGGHVQGITNSWAGPDIR